MPKPIWPLATVLLIVPLAASCGRPSLDQGLAQDEPPTVATSSISLADLVAMARQVKHFHRMQQLAALRQQEAEVVAVAFPLPEKQQQAFRTLFDRQTVAALRQQLLQAGHRLNHGVRDAAGRAFGAAERFHNTVLKPYQDAMPADEEPETTEQPVEEPEAPAPAERSDPLPETEQSPSDCWARCSLRDRLAQRWRLRNDSSRRTLDRAPIRSARKPLCRPRLRRR
jgi:hypothetical protein